MPAALLLLALLALPMPEARAQEARPSSTATEARALALAALAALGDPVALGLAGLTIRVEGTRYWIGQGPSSADREAALPLTVETAYDFAGGRLAQTQLTYQGPAVYFGFRTVLTPDESYNHELVTDVHFALPAEAAGPMLERRLASVPDPRGRLLKALRNAATLEVLEPVELDGRRTDVVGYADSTGARWRIAIDAERLVRRAWLEVPVPKPLGEPTLEEVVYDDYRAVAGLRIPHRVREARPTALPGSSVIWNSVTVTAVEAGPVDPAAFDGPGSRHPRRPDQEIAATEIASGVVLLENARPNYNVLAVDLGDGLLVVDAPGSDEASDRVLVELDRLFPDRPVRAVVATHPHYDHIEGLPAYVRRGARVVTTPAAAGIVADLVESARADAPGPSAEPADVIDLVEGSRSIEAAGRRVELVDLGPTPHADGLLVVHLPDDGILFVADVVSADWGRVRPAIPETYAFVDRFRRLGREIPPTILPAHGPPMTRADLERALAEGDRGIEVLRIPAGPASFSSNSWLLLGGEDAILVDAPVTAGGAGRVVETIRRTGRAPSIVFVTHAHPDHFLAVDRIVDAFPSARVVSTAAVAERVNALGPRLVERLRQELGQEGPTRFVPVEALADDRIPLGDERLRVVAFEGGEEEAAAGLHLPGARALVAGDVVYRDTHPYLGRRDLDVWRGQLDAIERMGLRTILPGHGPAAGPDVLDALRDYLDAFEAAIATGDRAAVLARMRAAYPGYAAPELLERFSVPAFLDGR